MISGKEKINGDARLLELGQEPDPSRYHHRDDHGVRGRAFLKRIRPSHRDEWVNETGGFLPLVATAICGTLLATVKRHAKSPLATVRRPICRNAALHLPVEAMRSGKLAGFNI